MTKNVKITLSIIVIILIVAVAYVFYAKKEHEITPNNNSNPSESFGSTSPITVGLDGINGGSAEVKTSDGTIVKVPALSKEAIAKIPKPNLDRTITVTTANTDDATKKQIENIIKQTIAEVKANPYSFDTWIKLGTEFKIAGDYQAAREMWEYVNLVVPTNVASFSNLGDLYQGFLKDYVKAEYNLKKVVQNDPNYIEGYVNLSNLYRYQLKDQAKAISTLKDGIAKNLKAVDLYLNLASYYKEIGDKVSALKYYNEAEVIAVQLKNEALVTSIKAEISGLSK
jgi:tetratricopeptide (TPR) repeat protein